MSQDEIYDKIDVGNPSNLFYKGMMMYLCQKGLKPRVKK